MPLRVRAAARRMGEFLSSITGRIFVILASGMIAAGTVAAFMASLASARELNQQFRANTADRLSFYVELLNSLSPAARASLLASEQLSIREQPPTVTGLGPNEELEALFARRGSVTSTARVQFADLQFCISSQHPPSMTDEDRLWQRPEIKNALSRISRPATSIRELPEFTFVPEQCHLVSVTLSDGTDLRFSYLSTPGGRTGPGLFRPSVVAMLLSAVAVLAYVVARIASAPLKSLSASAVELGMDLDHEPLRVTGPTEVKRAAEAFNAMQRRLQEHVGERTRMLAAITHDLQTPLTRLRLRLERVADENLRERLISDMEAMRDLIAEGLELARSADTSEPRVMLDLDSLCQTVVEDAADAGGNAVFEGGTGVVMPLQPLAMRRLLSNLTDNALKYGGCAVVSTAQEQGAVCVRVRDRGPGLPPDMLERVFDPFFRLEASRSRQSGGTGLGLTIARTLAAKNGGALTLRNHPDGGLEATVCWTVHPGART